jgi:1-phosphofructokinase family hexose kinase
VGEQLTRLLESYGIQHDLIWVEGETRIAHVIVETRHHRHSHIITGGLVTAPHHHQELLERTKFHLPAAKWLICAGSLPSDTPPDTLQHLIQAAKAKNVPSLIDSSGTALQLAAQARPTILKMNRAEMLSAFGSEGESLALLSESAQSLRVDRGLENLVITCGAEGILAITPSGVWHSRAPRQEAVNAAGAGDAVSAALAWRLTEGDDWPGALRWAAAVSAAVVRTPGTADCEMVDIQKILPQVTIQILS